MVVATVPVAAWGGPDFSRADAAPPPVPAPAPPTPQPAAPTTPIEARIRWRESIAHGSANAGWLQHGVQLPKDGPGFYTYNPYTQSYPNAAHRRYGTKLLVRKVVKLGRWWRANYPEDGRLGIGDLSSLSGGRFDLHASHQNGLDVDIRLPRRDGRERGAGPSTYDRERTQAVVDFLVAEGAVYVFYGPNLSVRGPRGRVMVWPNHDDHLHVRFAE